MSSRRRLYLNLKQSVTKLFKTSAHYLKEITGKHSLFEKPYFEKGYREMQLRLSNPSWSTPKVDPGFGLGFGPGPGMWPSPRKHTFIFDDGICGLSGQSGECGETIFLNGWIGVIPPGSGEREYLWDTRSSNPKGAQVQGIKLSLGGMSAQIQVKLGDNFTGTVTICAKANQLSGSFLKEIAFMVPSQIGGTPTAPGWVPSFFYALRNLPPIYTVREESRSWDCGCVDLEVTCLCEGAVWDDANSDDIVAISSACSVAIMDAVGTRTWTVSGSGVWLDSGFTLTSLTNTRNSVTIYTDASACGTFTITACGATGYVRCTEGQWIKNDALTISCCDATGGGACNVTCYADHLKYYCVFVGICYVGGGPSGGCNCVCAQCEDKTKCAYQYTYEWSC